MTGALSRQIVTSDQNSTMAKASRQSLENEIVEKQVLICKAFANPTRLRMLDLLGQHPWSSADLQKSLGVSKANLSQHVMVLKSAGVIARRREGREVFFSLAIPEVKQACKLIQHVLRAQIRQGQRILPEVDSLGAEPPKKTLRTSQTAKKKRG
jgi:DNA-binding transcriptional ArsR family regulator